MRLEEFIQDCLRQRNERRAEKEEEETRQRGDLEKLRNEILATAAQQAARAIPEPLREFVSYDGDEPSEEQLKGFPGRWMPFAFKVEAPGLLPIHFITSTTGRESRVTAITVGLDKFGNDWLEAVAAAVIPVTEEETEVKR